MLSNPINHMDYRFLNFHLTRQQVVKTLKTLMVALKGCRVQHKLDN